MARPRRLIVGVLVGVGVVLLVAALRMGWEWKQAIDNVDAMIVAPVTLPTDTPEPRGPGSLLTEPQPTPEPTAVPEPDGPVNILLLGTDARLGDNISRTDAMILVHLDPRNHRVSMLSFPRDLW